MFRILVAFSIVLSAAPQLARAGDPNVSSCWDLRDFSGFQRDFGGRTSPRAVATSDLNVDAQVDLEDWVLLLAQCPTEPPATDPTPQRGPTLARIIIVLVVGLMIYVALTHDDDDDSWPF